MLVDSRSPPLTSSKRRGASTDRHEPSRWPTGEHPQELPARDRAANQGSHDSRPESTPDAFHDAAGGSARPTSRMNAIGPESGQLGSQAAVLVGCARGTRIRGRVRHLARGAPAHRLSVDPVPSTPTAMVHLGDAAISRDWHTPARPPGRRQCPSRQAEKQKTAAPPGRTLSSPVDEPFTGLWLATPPPPIGPHPIAPHLLRPAIRVRALARPAAAA